jgi:hypothetical protein
MRQITTQANCDADLSNITDSNVIDFWSMTGIWIGDEKIGRITG